MSDEPKPMIVIDGVPWWHWLYEYHWNGETYTFTMCARSREEADARIKRLPLARYMGQGDGDVLRANVISGLWIRALIWFRNFTNPSSTR